MTLINCISLPPFSHITGVFCLPQVIFIREVIVFCYQTMVYKRIEEWLAHYCSFILDCLSIEKIQMLQNSKNFIPDVFLMKTYNTYSVWHYSSAVLDDIAQNRFCAEIKGGMWTFLIVLWRKNYLYFHWFPGNRFIVTLVKYH